MSIKPVTVTQLSTYIKQIFDVEELLHNVSVYGEIFGWSNVRGTAYFTLKDDASTLSCVCFTADAFSNFKNGDSVMVVGTPRYYVKGGKLNFNVVRIEAYGQNLIFQKFLELKANLEQKGYFNPEHKIPMPSNIQRIGVVSSEGGAVIQDIINVRTRRNPAIDIVLYPVKVQGVNAEYEIAKGIQVLDDYNVDVIVVARGGGSFEDLQPFNTEVVANATYNCKKPIVSAVGHETDFTIIDFCSDLRAPTPSAAAELLCQNVSDLKQTVKTLSKLLSEKIDRYLENEKFNILDNLAILNNSIKYIEEQNKTYLNDCIVGFNKNASSYISQKQTELLHKIELLKKLNPQEVLKLGYASLKNKDKYVVSVNDVDINDNVQICLKDGKIEAIVKNKENL
ncbi:MAG: exodeoxyribonuclease VII large subunit [Clostridiales bacterium]|nr:exodeoxyribonuclease VII large subunit [Clostridiales bacterium]